MRIDFWGNFGAGNLGNECTLQAMVHNARSHLPGAELTCICSQPVDVALRHGLEALPISSRRVAETARPGARRSSWLGRALRSLPLELRDWYRAFARMRQTDVLMMCGTGMLSDAGEGPRGLPYEMLKWSLAAKLCGTRLLFVSVGAESIWHPLTKTMIKAALRLADYRCYRDRQSRNYLQRLGLDAQNDAVYPDLAFSLPESLIAGPRDAPGRAPVVAVGLYDYRGRGAAGAQDDEAYRSYLGKIGGFVTWLLQRDLEVRIIIGDVPYDEPVRRDVRAWLEARGVALEPGRFADEPATSVERLMEQLAGVDLVVATRFHCVLLALMLAKPVVSISYNEKNEVLMGAMGLARYCQTLEQFDLERLIDQFRDLESNAERLAPAVREKTREYRSDLDELYARIFASTGDSQPGA